MMIKEDDIYYHLGTVKYNWAHHRKGFDEMYKRKYSEGREGIISYIKDTSPLILKNKDEVIPRSEWNIPSLIGETERQLFHESYWNLNEYVKQHHTRKHDILTIFECSNAKPYSISRIMTMFTQRFSCVSDFACISNPGIIPVEYSHFYPYRYDEWNHFKEGEDIVNKYCTANIGRILDYREALGYKHVIIVMQHPHTQKTFDIMYENNIENCREWLHIMTNDSFRKDIEDIFLPIFKNKGCLITRIMNLKYTREMFYAELYKYTDDEGKKLLEEMGSILDNSKQNDMIKNITKFNKKHNIQTEFTKMGKKHDWKLLTDDDIDTSLIDTYHDYIYNKLNSHDHTPYFTVMDMLMSYYNYPIYLRDIDRKYHTMEHVVNKYIESQNRYTKLDTYIFLDTEKIEKEEGGMKKFLKSLYKKGIINK